MGKYDFLKRLLSNPSVEKAEAEGLQDLAHFNPASMQEEILAARKAAIADTLEGAPKSGLHAQDLDSQLGVNKATKSAEESAGVLGASPGDDFQLGGSSSVETPINPRKLPATQGPRDIVLSPGRDYSMVPSGEIPISATPEVPSSFDLKSLGKKLASLPKDHPYLTGGSALGAYALSQGGSDKPAEASAKPVPASAPVDEESDDSTKSTAKSIVSKANRSPAVDPNTLDLTKATSGEPNMQDTLARLNDNRDRQHLIGQLGKAAQTIGQGFSGVKPADPQAFDEIGKMGEQPLKDFQAKLDHQKFDPASVVSKSYRDFAKQIGVKVADNASAADLEKLTPLIEKFQQAKEAAAGRRLQREMMASAKSDQMKSKLEVQMGEKADQLLGPRGSLNRPNKVMQAADSLNALAARYGTDLDKMPPNMVSEFVQQFNVMVTGGQGNMHVFQKLLPSNIKMEGANVAQWLMSEPKGAQQKKFIENLMDSAKTERATAEAQIKEGLIKHYKTYESKVGKDELEKQKGARGITQDDEKDFKPGSLIKKAYATPAAQAPVYEYSPSRNKTRITYPDGKVEIKDGNIHG